MVLIYMTELVMLCSTEKNYAHRGQFMSPSERKEKKKARSKPRVTVCSTMFVIELFIINF